MRAPYLQKQGDKTILMADERPFVMLCGELHNSNSSTEAAMRASCEKAAALGLNSVIAPVAWEQLEPVQGTFDFGQLDMVIRVAREYGLRLELIWFGSWKNAQMYYAPEWVKKDMETFRRAEMQKGCAAMRDKYGMQYTTLSYICDAAREADAAAFRKLMEHVREIDGETHTVLMVQVENETGVQGAAREHSDEADRLFASEAPQALVSYMKAHTDHMAEDVKCAVMQGAESGTWEACFGDVAEEVFSAYYVAAYVNYVAAAGKEAYDIPMSANCWLDKGGKPGEYPSGGPVERMMEVWQCAAPAIDVIAPDIYVPDFCGVCDAYTKNGNPLFIPEAATHSYAAVRLMYAVGHHHAICYSPFGFEDIGEPFTVMQGFLFGMDVTDPALKEPQNAGIYHAICRYLQGMMPLLGEKLGTGQLQAVISERPEEDTMAFEQFGVKVIMTNPMTKQPNGPAGALALQDGADTLYVLVHNATLMPFSADKEKPFHDFIDLEEGYFDAEGAWVTTLRRNGDEAVMLGFEKPTLLRIKLFAHA